MKMHYVFYSIELKDRYHPLDLKRLESKNISTILINTTKIPRLYIGPTESIVSSDRGLGFFAEPVNILSLTKGLEEKMGMSLFEINTKIGNELSDMGASTKGTYGWNILSNIEA